MVFDYTPDEWNQLTEIDNRYGEQLSKIDAAIDADPDAVKDDYTGEYLEQVERINAERMNKWGLLYDKFEQARFDALGGDPDAILANGKEQIDLIIKRRYEINTANLEVNKELKDYFPDDLKYLVEQDPRIDWETANATINSGIRLHIDFLKEKYPKKYESLRNYKYSYLRKSPLITDRKKPQPLNRMQPQTPADDLLKKEFIPMLNNTATNDFAAVSLKKHADKLSKQVSYTTPHGDKYRIENIDKLYGSLATSVQKILYTAISYLTRDNYSKGGITKATVEIPLYSYAEANGKQLTPYKMDTPEKQKAENKRAEDRLKAFKRDVRNDLHDLKQVNFTWNKMKGKTKGDCAEQPIISSYRITTTNNAVTIRINFDVETAKSLSSAGIMQFPKVLLKHDNRNSNGFSIGYAIAVHSSNLQNISAKTAETLRVETLLADAPDIPTIDELKAKGRRDWKEQIKKKLEYALDSNVKIGYLDKWEYRDGRTCEILTREQASKLSWADYINLRVDYHIAKDNPELEDYTQRKQAEKAAAKEKAKEKKAANNKKTKKTRDKVECTKGDS